MGGVIGAWNGQHSSIECLVLCFTQHDSLSRLRQKAYQVLATHRRAELGGGSADYFSLCSIARRGE
jgi:hypothetical protein